VATAKKWSKSVWLTIDCQVANQTRYRESMFCLVHYRTISHISLANPFSPKGGVCLLWANCAKCEARLARP
jgi:hypothetical protein